MKMIVFIALALVAVTAAAPLEPVPIVRSASETQPDGAYSYSFESGDGTQREENGEIKQVQDEDKQLRSVIVVRGRYSYPGVDGKTVSIVYSADENGFNAEGDSIPKSSR